MQSSKLNFLRLATSVGKSIDKYRYISICGNLKLKSLARDDCYMWKYIIRICKKFPLNFSQFLSMRLHIIEAYDYLLQAMRLK